MKKYVTVIVMLVLIIVPITSHYVISAKESNIKDSFELEKISGDTRYVNDVTIEGDFSQGRFYDTFTLSKDEFKQGSDDTRQQRLINKYKSFMRGKNINYYNTYESDNELIYVDIKDYNDFYMKGSSYKLRVELLNKKTKDVQKFDIESEVIEDVNWLTVSYVVKHDNVLKIYTENQLISGDVQLIEHTVDVTTQEHTTKTFDFPVKEGHSIGISVLNDVYSLNRETNMLIAVADYDDTNDDETNTVYTLYLHDTKTGEVSEMNTNEKVSFNNGSLGTFINNKLIIQIPEEDGVVIEQLDISTNEWIPKQTISYPLQPKDPFSITTRVINDNLYTFTAVDKGYLVLVNSLKDGSSLFEGIINNEKELELYVNRVYENVK